MLTHRKLFSYSIYFDNDILYSDNYSGHDDSLDVAVNGAPDGVVNGALAVVVNDVIDGFLYCAFYKTAFILADL